MSYYINPTDYTLNEDAILIVYDRLNKNVVNKIKITPDKILKIDDINIIENINSHQYLFKLRTNKGKESKDLTKYFYIIKKQNFTDYWLDKLNLSETQILNHINYFSREEKIMEIRNSFYAVCNNILINFNAEHKNLEDYLYKVNNLKIEMPILFQNINTYLKYILDLKNILKAQKLNHLYFDDFVPLLKINGRLYNIIQDFIRKSELVDLQFVNYLTGCLYSMIGDRNNAVKAFNEAESYNNNYGVLFGIGQGTSTYIDNVDKSLSAPSISYYNSVKHNEKLETVIISVDERFLRNYGTIILNNILILRKYQFHIHVVGKSNSIIKAIAELDLIFNQMVMYFDKTTHIYKPSFSYEIVNKEIADINTYSACARFVHANKFMDDFNTDLYIMDADCLITNDLETYGKNFLKSDIGIALSRSMSPIMPWKRLLAGDSYFANNNLSKKFLQYTTEYILSNVQKEKAWTLDQNALSYAYEKMQFNNVKIDIKNIYKIRRPFLHAPISNLIEKN